MVNKKMVRLKEFIKGFKKGQADFGECVSTLVNSILLSVVYFIGFGVTSTAGKLLKRSFLDLKQNKSYETYWEKSEIGKYSMEECLRQF